MKFIQILKDLGLTDKEPEIYLCLLKLPGAQPASVVARRLNMNRTTVYKALVNLAKKGLATETQRHGITCFFAETPEERLRSLIEDNQKNLEHMNRLILDELPLLIRSSEGDSSSLPRIRYYEGIEGIKQIYEAMLKEGKDVYRYGDIAKIYEALGAYTDEYIQKRKEIGFKTHAIEPSHEKKPSTSKHSKENREVLFIPHPFFPIEGEIRIFGNKVAIISLHQSSLIGVIIESQIIAKMFYSIFMLTWKNYSLKVINKIKMDE